MSGVSELCCSPLTGGSVESCRKPEVNQRKCYTIGSGVLFSCDSVCSMLLFFSFLKIHLLWPIFLKVVALG